MSYIYLSLRGIVSNEIPVIYQKFFSSKINAFKFLQNKNINLRNSIIMADIDFDVLFKMILVGDSGVGKSNILTRYTKDSFSFDSKATIGVEFGAKIFNIKDHTIKIQIWDTAGQERYRAITNAYYKGSKGAIIVFDLGRRETYDHVDKWWDDIQKYGDKDICIILIGNKCDLENRTVTKEEVLEKAKSLSNFYLKYILRLFI